VLFIYIKKYKTRIRANYTHERCSQSISSNR